MTHWQTIEASRRFLADLVAPNRTPNVPHAVRARAARLLEGMPLDVEQLFAEFEALTVEAQERADLTREEWMVQDSVEGRR